MFSLWSVIIDHSYFITCLTTYGVRDTSYDITGFFFPKLLTLVFEFRGTACNKISHRARMGFSRDRQTNGVASATFRVRSQQDGLGLVVTAAGVTDRVASVVGAGRRLKREDAQWRHAAAGGRRTGQVEQVQIGAGYARDPVHSHHLFVRRLDPNARVRAVAHHGRHVHFVRATRKKRGENETKNDHKNMVKITFYPVPQPRNRKKFRLFRDPTSNRARGDRRARGGGFKS